MPCLYPHHRNLQKNNDGNQNIGADKYSFLDIPIPPLQEQKAIARYIETTVSLLLVRLRFVRVKQSTKIIE